MLSKLLDIPNNLSVRVESAKCGQKRTTEKSGRNKKKKTPIKQLKPDTDVTVANMHFKINLADFGTFLQPHIIQLIV